MFLNKKFLIQLNDNYIYIPTAYECKIALYDWKTPPATSTERDFNDS